jgi:hypothetical protein
MQPSNDREANDPDRAMTTGVSRAPHPPVLAAEPKQPPDRIADLVTSIVDLVVELYGQPTGSAPSAAGDDPRLRAAITRLRRVEGSLEELTAEPPSADRHPARVPSSSSSDRGEWVESGVRP